MDCIVHGVARSQTRLRDFTSSLHFFDILYLVRHSSQRTTILINSDNSLGRSPGEGEDYPLNYPGLENSMDCTVCAEKAMAPYSSTLAWKIPWMEEPGRLQSMGSLRVGHD